jgi:hypothetical protein
MDSIKRTVESPPKTNLLFFIGAVNYNNSLRRIIEYNNSQRLLKTRYAYEVRKSELPAGEVSFYGK